MLLLEIQIYSTREKTVYTTVQALLFSFSEV